MLELKRNRSEIDLDEVVNLYHKVGWTNHTHEKVEKIFTASTHTSFVFVDKKLAGLGRALSDGIFNASIYDVIVSPSFQGEGYGKLIVNDLLSQLEEVSCVHLISTSGNEEFYRKLGFKRTKTGMARYLNRLLDKEYLQ